MARCLWNLGFVLHSHGRPAEALPNLQAALEMRQRLFKGDHGDVAMSLNRVGECLLDLGRPAEALPKFEAALEMRRRLLPAGDLEIAGEIAVLAGPLLDHHEFAKAEPLLRECLAIRNEKLPAEHWQKFNAMSMLGGALAGQVQDPALALAARIAKLEEAEPLLLEGYAGLEESPRVPPYWRGMRIREALERIIKLYDAWDRLAPVTGYAEKAAEWRARLVAYDEAAASGPAP